jgi:NAD(P)-dependent dehydrogenase (short-subunit alcohol dehydrogenase family)
VQSTATAQLRDYVAASREVRSDCSMGQRDDRKLGLKMTAMQVANRVCLLTGASGTLGTAFCQAYAGRYAIAAVYHCNHPPFPSQTQWFVDPLAIHAPVSENANPIFAVRANLAEDEDLTRVVEMVFERFGKIDLLVNAAAYSYWTPLSEAEEAANSLSWHFYLNATIPFKLSMLIASKFWRNRKQENQQFNRNIVNVSSIAGLNIYPNLGQAAYSTSKAALNHLSCHMAHEFAAFGIRVNALAPNSFPAIIETDCAARGIARLDAERMTGKILVLDRDNERLI